MTEQAPRSGYVAGVLAEDRRAKQRAAGDRRAREQRARREWFDAMVARALELGFSERQAPFAAMAAVSLVALGVKPTRRLIRARVLAQYPWLFAASGGGLGDGG